MKQYIVRVSETRFYEMNVIAKDEEEARDIARDRFDSSDNPVADFVYDPDDEVATKVVAEVQP